MDTLGTYYGQLFEKVDLTWTFHGLIMRDIRLNGP